jgi:CheY-like chemotaxis protein
MEHRLDVALPDEPVWVHGDRTRLVQVVSNLLNNACKFMRPGGRIALSAGREGGQAVVRVRDWGFGIAADQLPRIFDKFTQVDTSLERSAGGLGIGLSLVKRLVEMHGGIVEARSEGLDRGSEFVVRIPVLDGVAPAPEPALPPAAIAARSRRILIADDNEDGADTLGTLLQMFGHRTHLARDGQEAVEVAERERPDVVLLDIGMPRLNGYEACRVIRSHEWGKDMLLVAVTGWGQETDQLRSKQAGFDAHLVKPITLEAVTEVLAAAPQRASVTRV